MSYPLRLRTGSVAEKKAKNGVNSEKKSASKGRRVVEPGPPAISLYIYLNNRLLKTHVNATFELMTAAVSAGSSSAVIELLQIHQLGL